MRKRPGGYGDAFGIAALIVFFAKFMQQIALGRIGQFVFKTVKSRQFAGLANGRLLKLGNAVLYLGNLLRVGGLLGGGELLLFGF